MLAHVVPTVHGTYRLLVARNLQFEANGTLNGKSIPWRSASS
jgi:hypothetical protein